jgi:Fic family protein
MKFLKERAGKYKKQKGGFETFVPRPLPPDPPIELDNKLLNYLSKADVAVGRLDGLTEVLPNPNLFVMMYIKKEAVLSSQIEGTQATLMDVLEFEAKTLDPNRPSDTLEVLNYVRSVSYGLEKIKQEEISVSLIEKLHFYLLEGTRGGEREPGKIRTVQNWIGPPKSEISEAVFVPPNVKDMKNALKDLEAFIKKEVELPPLIKAGLIHYQFETVHPFLDGNGRIGRLLITLLLAKTAHLSRPLLYLSYYFKQNRTEYYNRLQNVRDSGEWEKWLHFFLEGIYYSTINAINASMKIIELRKNQQELLTDKLGNKSGSGLRLFEELFNRPIITVNTVKEITGLSFPNANRLASLFEELGIVTEVTGQKRNRIYEFKKYMDILNEGI